MGNPDTNADRLLEMVGQIRAYARERELTLFYGYVGGGDDAIQWNEEQGGGWREFVDCAKSLGARILYLNWAPFEEFQVADALEEAQALPAAAPGAAARDAASLSQEIEGYREKVGLTAVIDLAFLADGIFHTLEIEADWFRAFQELLPEGEGDEGVNDQAREQLVRKWAPKLASAPEYARCTTRGEQRHVLRKLAGAEYDGPAAEEILDEAKAIYELEVYPERARRLGKEARELKARGETLQGIAAKLGVSNWQVRKLLAE